MIKRSFIGLTGPKLRYDLVEPDPREPELYPTPPRLLLLLNEPLDSTRETLVKTGDSVKRGERLFLYKDSTEYAVSPVTGTLTSIASYNGDFGAIATYVIIEKSAKDDPSDDFAQQAETPNLKTCDAFLRSLPGAPDFKTLVAPGKSIHTIVIAGVDEDIACTTRQYLLATAQEEIRNGIQILRQMTGISKIALTIPEKAPALAGFEGIQQFRISSIYPAAFPQMIIQQHLKLSLPPGNKPEDIGIWFISAEAVIAIGKAYHRQEPVYEKLVTIIGKDGAKHRIKAVIGTPIHRLFKHFNLATEERDRIIIGGPMKGFAAYTLYHPVEPGMDTIIIQDKSILPHISDYPCINCGKCIRVCPANVPVNLLVRYLEADLYEEAADSFDLESCIECGLCSYVCTARIPLFQYIRLGKHELLRMELLTEMEATNA